MVAETSFLKRTTCWLLTFSVLLLQTRPVNAGWYLGCFKEKPEDRAFNISAGNYIVSDTSAQECTSACAYLNQTYAATEGELCFCKSGFYDIYGQASSESLCDVPCSGLSCSNTSYIRVYSTEDAIEELRVYGPQTGWLLEEVNFTTTLSGKGDPNVSYTYDFGDGSYVLTTCPHTSHVYTRVGHFHVKASARTNVSGPIMASTWVFIQSSTGKLSLDYPQEIVEAENDTKIVLSVSQGTWMEARFLTSPPQLPGKRAKFNVSDAIVYDIGSSATLGNTSSFPETDGAYVIPSAMMKKDGYILAWEFVASKIGPIRLQVYRPNCSSANEHFCPRNHSCIPKAESCVSPSLFTCPTNSICLGSGHCLSNCQSQNVSFPSSPSPLTDYVIVAETLVDITKTGKNLIFPDPAKAIEVQAGDVIGWVSNTSSGALAFEQTIDDPSFFYSSSKFSTSMGSTLTASGGATRYDIKHILRAHVSQPSQAAVNVNFIGAGIHKVTVVVDNVAGNELKTCEVSVQERIENLRITSPFTNVSYATGQKIRLQSEWDKGSNMSFIWATNGTIYNKENPEVVYNHIGLYPISVHASNNISSANASSVISILQPVSLAWIEKPPSEVDVDVPCNFSFVVNGTNVTLTIDFGDGSPPNETFFKSALNTVVNISHIYTKYGKHVISIKAKNNIPTTPPPLLTFKVQAMSDIGEIIIQLDPAPTTEGVLRIATQQNFEIHVSVSEKQVNRTVNYTFHLGLGKDDNKFVITNDGDTKVTHMYETETDFNITITAHVEGYEEKKFVRVIARPCGPPAMYFPNSYKAEDPQIVTKGTKIDFFKIRVEKTADCQGDPEYLWNLSPAPIGGISASDRNKASFELEPGSLDIGNYNVTLNISYTDKNTQVEEKYWYQTFLRVENSPLVASISGGSYREMDSSTNFTKLELDASKSSDPDNENSNLNFQWTCKFEGNSVPPVPDELCNSTGFVNVSEGSRRSQSAQQRVKFLPNIPSLKISCRDCQDKINPFERLTLEGKCTNCKSYQQLTETTWKLLDSDGNEDELSGNANVTDPNLGWTSINLVIKENTLKRDTKYIAQLTGKRGSRESTVQFSFETTSPPESGSCKVTPKEGEAAETLFKIGCENWVTKDNPISYKFRYQVNMKNLAEINTLSTESRAYQLWYFGERTTPSRVLPIGDPEDDFKLHLSARICNKYECCADVFLDAVVKKADVQQVTDEKIGQELDKVDAKEEPKKVVQLVNSYSSIINYGNKSDTGTQDERTKIRTELVNKLTDIDLTDTTQAQQTIGALIEATKDKTELTAQTQNKGSGIIEKASRLLNKAAKDLGPVTVEEQSREILTASSNMLEASKETTSPYIEEALKDIFPTTAPPPRAWSFRISSLKNQQDAEESKKVVDKTLNAINLVSAAIQKKRVAEEGETVVKTNAFFMNLKRSRKDAFNTSAYTIQDGSTVRVNLPRPNNVVRNLTNDPIDVQYTSLKNIFLSDAKSSPYIDQAQGFALKQGVHEVKIEDLAEDLEINIPTDLASVSERYSEEFKAGTNHSHRFQLPPDTPYEPLLVYVKPERNETLTTILHISFEASPSREYKLRFSPTFKDEEVPSPFRKVDSFTYMAWKLPARPVYFNLTVLVTEPFADGEGSGNKSRAVRVNYTVAIYPVRCMYWGMEEGKWLEEGCKVGEKTSIQATQCQCNHATFYGSLNVKPNPIGPPTLAKLQEGYAMLVFVAVIFSVYCLGLIWARRKDRADVIKVGVCPLRDNDPTDPYRYELTLWTGMRRNAGSKSKVSIIMYGDEQDSEARALEDPDRNPFQRGSQDTFLLTTPFDLGTIQYIRIWHDNTGGSWFLSRIMVIDLQTDERYYFICNRWLAVDEEDGQVERLVPLASKAELTEFGHLFVARTRRNLSDSHLWFSVLARPANSRFTRVQRLSCCLCLLFMSMMASGMYYDRQDDPANVQQVGTLVFTWNQVLVGIISSLIVFPINLIVVQIFRNVRPKPKIKPKRQQPSAPALSFTQENLENYNHLKESSDESAKGSNNSLDSSREKNNRTRLSINDVHTDVDRASFTDSPLLIDRRLSTTYEITPTSRARRLLLWFKKRNTLPYYFMYVAWFFLFVFTTGSAVVVIFYGMEFGNIRSLQWLFSSCVSFVQDVFITQPLKVLGLAVFFALVVKKPDKGEFEITEEALQLAEDEEFIQQSGANPGETRSKKPKLLPPDQARLIAMRAARMKERKMYSVIREIVTFYVFLALLLMIAYTHRDQMAFRQTKNLFNEMGSRFSNITSQEEFWNWTRTELLDGLFPTTWYNGKLRKPDGFMADGYSQMVGGARMRLIRIKKESCKVPTEVYGITNECYGEYFITKDDKNDYTEGWQNITTYDTKISWDDMQWRYQNGTQLDGYPFWAQLNTYSGGGYVIVLEPGMENHDRLEKLQDNIWVERHTRAVLTEFTIYNAQSNLFCIVTLVAEFPATGGVIPHTSIQTARLYDFTDNTMFLVLACESIFVMFILFFLYREVKHIYKTGIQAYLKEFWNCVELAIILFTFAAIALYVYRALTIRNVLDLVRHDPFNFKSFQFAGYWDETYTFVLAIIVLLANIKLNKLLRFNKRFSLLSSTLKYAYYPLLMFSIIWGIVFTAFTLVASLVFGPVLHSYRSIVASLTSLLSLMLGRTAYFEMRDTNRILGPLFFFGFMFMMSFVLINMFLSIVVDSFKVVKRDNDKQSNEYEIVDFIIERFKLWSGIGKTRRPHSRGRVLWDTAASRVKAVNLIGKKRGHSAMITGLHEDTVSELENRLEKLIDRTDVLYEELFPEKKFKVAGKRGGVSSKGSKPVSKADLLEGQTG
ncbi:hypothetical protein ACROYT_G038703 [Oculina patagonica]